MGYDFPDTGNDYDTLARLTQPQMMGNAPVGAGGMAGMMYGQDVARHDEMLRRSAQLADLNATMKGQASNEYMQGGPGRLADITLRNSMSQGQLGNLPDLLQTQGNKAATGAAQSRAEKIQAIKSQLYTYANDHAAGASLDDIRSKMESDGVTQIGNRSLKDIPDEKLDEMFKNIRKELINTPKHAQDIEKQQAIGDSWVRRVDAQNTGKREVAEIAAGSRRYASDNRVSIENLKQEFSKLKPQSQTQVIGQLWAKEANGTITDREAATLNTIRADARYNAVVRAAMAGPQPDIAQFTNLLKAVDVPKPAPLPSETPPESTPTPVTDPAKDPSVVTTGGWTLNLKNGQAIKGNQKLTIKSFTSKTYTLSDGTVIPKPPQ